MKFFEPSAFWLLWLLPVIVVFYLLKRKRFVRLVSSTVLWQRFLAENQANAPFQKLRHNWLLILQLLLLLLVIFALARPFLPSDARESRFRVLILDGSASMQSQDESPSRFEKARQLALNWVDGLRDEDQMMVLQAGANTEVKQSATSDKSALRRAVQSAAASDSPTRLGEAFKLAETLMRNRTDAEIHLFSDGAIPSVEEFQNQSLPIVYHQVGTRANNAGIIHLDTRPNPENPQERALFVGVGNYSTNKLETELELYFEGTLIEARPIALAPRETAAQVFLTEQIRDGVYKVRLLQSDDLAADNEASIFSRVPQSARVLLVTPGNKFLEKALKVLPYAEVTQAASLPKDVAAFDLLVLDGVTPDSWPEKNMLVFQSVNTNWFESWSPVENPPIVGWRSTHPLMRFVTLDNVYVGKSLAVKTTDWGVSLVDAPQTSLILAGDRGRQRLVWIGFDLLDSDWWQRLSFPIFIANTVDWLNPANAQLGQTLVRAGDPFRMVLPEKISSVEVTLPNGTREVSDLPAGASEFVFGNTRRHGVYQVQYGTNTTVFCVNLMNAAESDTTPVPELPFDKFGNVQTSVRRANVELWRWVAAVGLLVLLFEWWFYHRRTA